MTDNDEFLNWVGHRLEGVAIDLQNGDVEAAGDSLSQIAREIQRETKQ